MAVNGMNPKSLPLTIAGVLILTLGTGLVGCGVGLPIWQEMSYPKKPNHELGLFQECTENEDCSKRLHISDELRVVSGFAIAGGATALLALVTALILLFMSCGKGVNTCMLRLPSLTLIWSLISGAAIVVALVVFHEEEFDSDEWSHLGLSFVLTAAGGGFVVIGGVMSCIGGHLLNRYLRRRAHKHGQPGSGK